MPRTACNPGQEPREEHTSEGSVVWVSGSSRAVAEQLENTIAGWAWWWTWRKEGERCGDVAPQGAITNSVE